MNTMVHELTHMDIPNHGSEFYEKQNELRKMYESFEKINWDNGLDNGLDTNILPKVILFHIVILFLIFIYIFINFLH